MDTEVHSLLKLLKTIVMLHTGGPTSISILIGLHAGQSVHTKLVQRSLGQLNQSYKEVIILVVFLIMLYILTFISSFLFAFVLGAKLFVFT